MDQQFNYTLNCDGDSNVATLYTGTAPELPTAKRVKRTGTITAPANWMDGKVAAGYEFNKAYMHAVVNSDDGTIELVSNDENEEHGGQTIVGKLKPHTATDRLGINTNREYSAAELMKTLKMNRSLFADRDENLAVVQSLGKFKGSVTKQIEQHDDLSGNEMFHFEQSVSSEFNLSFTLECAVYKGEPKARFKVDIRFSIASKSVTYWLESPELAEIQDTQRAEALAETAERLMGHEITIIYQ